MRRLWKTWIGVALVTCLYQSPASADVFHLQNGGEIEGQLRGETDTHYQVRTFVGEIEIEKADVTKYAPGPSIFDDYDRHLALLSNTADDLVELANWCGENGLSKERRAHLDQALRLDPDHAEARAALGYTRVGNLWIESQKVLETQTQREHAAAQAQREAEREQQRQFAAMKYQLRDLEKKYFVGSTREPDLGEAELVSFSLHHPLAMSAMFEYLKGRSSLLMRARIVKVFANSPDPQTTLYIAYAALKDPARKIRQYAINELITRDIKEVVRILAAALDINSEVVKMRTANLLSKLDGRSAIPALIDNLVGKQKKRVEYVWQVIYGYEILWWYDDTAFLVQSPEHPLAYDMRYRREDAAVYRHALRAALRDLTGEDFGFDQQAWRAWYKKQPSI